MKMKNKDSRLLTALCLACLVGSAAQGEDAPKAARSGPAKAGQKRQAELGYNPGPGWNLAWSDEFDGTSLNAGSWTTLTSNWDPVTNNCTFGTGELEFPRAQNVTVGNGKLVITAERTSDNPHDSRCGAASFYSGRIHTKGKVEKTYGKIVASIKVPSGFGMWSAFWTLGANIQQVGWPQCGELDILEWNSNEPTWMKSAVHWDANGKQADWGTGASTGANLGDSFHIYELEWSASTLIFRVDGKMANANFNGPDTEFQQNHYLILNLAVGGNWYGNPSPDKIALPAGQKKTMEVEWVRWYQH